MGVLDSSYIKALGVKSPELKKIFLIFTDTLIYISTNTLHRNKSLLGNHKADRSYHASSSSCFGQLGPRPSWSRRLRPDASGDPNRNIKTNTNTIRKHKQLQKTARTWSKWINFSQHLFERSLTSLRAESARAVTGRRCPHSGRGEDFLTGQLNFFAETAVTPEWKVEKWFPRWEINRHA